MTAEPITSSSGDLLLAGRIATLMRTGTAAVSTLLMAGVILMGLGQETVGKALLTVGFSLLILMPLARLIMMTRYFAQRAEKGFVILTCLVIALIIAGAAMGTVL